VRYRSGIQRLCSAKARFHRDELGGVCQSGKYVAVAYGIAKSLAGAKRVDADAIALTARSANPIEYEYRVAEYEYG
jgi:hypothetical protein